MLSALLVLAEAQHALGDIGQALRTADRASALADETGSPSGIAQALLIQGSGQVHQGRYDQALARFHEARSMALEHDLSYHLAAALSGIRQVQSNTNALREALVTVREELILWRDLGMCRREAEALEGEAMIHDMLGHPSASLRALNQAHEISRRLGAPLRLAVNQYNRACSLLYHDDARAPEAIRASRQALDSFRRYRQPAREVAALTILGYALWVDDRHQAALDVLEEAYAACEAIDEPARLPELLAYQGLAYLGLGRPGEALSATRRAVLALAQGTISDEVVPEVYFAHAMALVHNKLEEQATSYLSQAYAKLLKAAAQFKDEESRQAFFRHNPTLRRLMGELVARGLAPDPDAGIIARTLPSTADEGPLEVLWTVDAGPADAALRQAQGSIALRRARLGRLLREARAQGADPSTADLAEVLGVSRRTVQRDLVVLRSS
jgi:tetratricopeptide (TPR) repeat protein